MSEISMKTLKCSDFVGRDNNLTLIRLIAALAVIWGHAFPITHFKDKDPVSILVNGYTFSGTIAVSAFFALSGFLVARSYHFNPNIFSWCLARIARIYPGLIVCVFMMLLYVFFVYRFEDGLGFFTSNEVLEFVRYNTVLDNVKFSITGAFPDNARPERTNGSFWTLPGEIRVYILFSILSLIGIATVKGHSLNRYKAPLIFLTCFALIVWSYVNHVSMPIIMDNKDFASPTRYFLLGVIFFVLRDKIPLNPWIFLVVLFLPYVAWEHKDIFLFLFMWTTTYSVFYIGYGMRWLKVERLIGDWSYGIYIYGWFIQQVVASFNINQTPQTNAILSSLIAIIVGAISWKLVERPCLELRKRIKISDYREVVLDKYMGRKP